MIQAAPAVRAVEADAPAKKQSNWIAFLFFAKVNQEFPFIINLLKIRYQIFNYVTIYKYDRAMHLLFDTIRMD